MQILKNKIFSRWATKIGLSDLALIKIVEEISHGLYEAYLGGSIYKKRVSIANRGKRNGARTIIAYKSHNKAFFIYGYTKNESDNINKKEELALKALADVYFSYNETEINHAVKFGELIEVKS